ncbi:MAG: hypothetical protein QXP36_01390 [Conexivisphaerales archaeon]
MDANILEPELGQEKANICEKVLRKFCIGELEGVLFDFAIDTIVIVMKTIKRQGIKSGFSFQASLAIEDYTSTSPHCWTEPKLQAT